MTAEEIISGQRDRKLDPSCASLRRRVRCSDTGQVWENANVAARALNISYSGIYNCCRGKQKTCFNLHFEWVE